jgi:hypothetical protein
MSFKNMRKIDSLTPEQQALIPIVRDEWINLCLNSDGGNKRVEEKDIREGIDWLYADITKLKNKTGGVQVLVEATNPQQQYLKVEKGQIAELEHQEHNTIEIPEGIYVQIQERRFDPFSGMIVRARD